MIGSVALATTSRQNGTETRGVELPVIGADFQTNELVEPAECIGHGACKTA